MSNFAFLAAEWPEVYQEAQRAEQAATTDPRTACFYGRRALEVVVDWLYRHDRTLHPPFESTLSALIHEPSFKALLGDALLTKARLLKDLGNQAVHSGRPVTVPDAHTAVRELFHLCFWLARSYARGVRPADGLAFDPAKLPATSPLPPQARAALQALLKERDDQRAKLAQAEASSEDLRAEVERLKDEVAKAKAANAATPDTHDYSEAETRSAFIDLLLREAGWLLDQPRDREFEVVGMPTKEGTLDGTGYVDYVLWGDDGLPLAVVEAKRTTRDAKVGQQQAKLYADCLEAMHGQRPVIFYTNGYQHWLWDDSFYPPRQVQGFLKKDELALMIQRRKSRKPLATAAIDGKIVERHYQTRAIRRIAEHFETDHQRRSLVVMATGAGKTRTVIALCDLLMRCNWAKRVLFLADRIALVNQAVNAFKAHLKDAPPVNLLDRAASTTEGRVYVSTYPTMLGLIDQTSDDAREFGVGHFDLVVIDEAHRSVYQKYGAIFDYFDSLLVGLTATPKDEVDHNTYRLFNLQDGVPTDNYGLDEAVADGFLVPATAISVPIKFVQQGIKYDDLTEEEKERYDELEWPDDALPPPQVDAGALNQWLFNQDTVDKVLLHLMERGQKVAGGDRLGKTIIFARNHNHAEYIAERFNANYPHYKGEFARVIDFQVEKAQSLINDFSKPDSAPHIAISVDMLDTGIDVPEVVNLVFFKQVRSRTKFWQMVGRGTRLCRDLFGPGQHKETFYIFDYCGNLEYFSANVKGSEGSRSRSLSQRLFTARVQVLTALDKRLPTAGHEIGDEKPTWDVPDTETDLRQAVADVLHHQVQGMNPDNFIVRPKLEVVERYQAPEQWQQLTAEQAYELEREVAGLPTEVVDNDEEAKRFDLVVLRLQLCVLRGDKGFDRLRDQVRTIAANLEELATIPAVKEQLPLLEELQSAPWWQDVTAPMLERVRQRLRGLVHLIEKAKKAPIYTDFEDTQGEERIIELPGFSTGVDIKTFQAKARQFLTEHEDHVAVQKLRLNKPLTASDLNELERMLLEAGVGSEADIARAKETSKGLGLFIRSLVGLDREAAKAEFSAFLLGGTATANQIEFINLIVDHLTEHGVMDPRLLYESPFVDVNSQGPDGVFTQDQVDDLFERLKSIRERAVA